MTAWVKDSIATAYYAQVDEGNEDAGYYVAARSAAGDYYAGFCEIDSAGADSIEYFSTLAQAKRWCEKEIKASSVTNTTEQTK